ncbi:MAG TPA: LysM peptidoglycan-binding domain-containing protein, partial [Candidatus Aquicultoraceae bacterium]|nr:LysM peptidoglycan-binding domain-containing protein [Candidatus Aquicultoraceae bacterium]
PRSAAADREAAYPPVPLRAGKAEGATDSREKKEDQDPDLVLSPREVEGEIAEKGGGEPVLELDDGFFANAPDEIDKGDEGSHAGLTDRIDKFIRYFQTRGRDRFTLWLARSGKYSDMMRGILAQYGMPGDLVYLALIESGFSPTAYSVARASGPWQFISGTARRYGLRVDWWTDERRDYEKSTHAAATYLKELYGMFESWPLAAAAYNAGEGKILRAVSRYKTEDYAKLIRYRYLAPETKDYVPKMLAALAIARDPEKYGFGSVQYEEPLAFDKVIMPGGTDIAAAGRILGVHADSLRELNPQFRRFCTPPNQEACDVRIPKGFALVAGERMEEIRTEAKVTFLLHKVGKRESLASLSEKYGTPVETLKEVNGLRRNSLRGISRLVIPVTGLSAEHAVPGTEISPDRLVGLAHMRIDDGIRRGTRVRVRRGDTLSKIARRSGVPVSELMRANGLRHASRLRAGSLIRIPRAGSVSGRGRKASASASRNGLRHVVRPGETLWSIARAHGISVKGLAARNNLNPGQPLRCGKVLVIPAES